MKRLLVLLIVVLAIGFVSAQPLQTKQWAVVETTITNPVEFDLRQNYRFDYLEVEFSWIPKSDYRQEVNELFLSQQGILSEDKYTIRINEPEDFTIEVVTITNSTLEPVRVDRKVEFPIRNLNQSLVTYLDQTELIDINDDIRNKAFMLAEGQDDLYQVVFDIGVWVNKNIEYNLSTLTAEASLPSSWVFENREGVCVELSNLFISMLRSLGIPARFVSGMAYTDSVLFDENWGAHGWAEVYFPGYGWIPFDPTYNQLGFVDATHIKFNHGVDSSKYPNTFTWSARNVEVNPGALSISSELLQIGEDKQDDVLINVVFEEDSISFDSYNVVRANITNLNNYYVARSYNIATVDELSILSEERFDLLLGPYESKQIQWVVYVSRLDSNFLYSFPVVVYSNMGEQKREVFTVSSTGKTISNAYIRTLDLEQQESEVVDFSCELLSTGYVGYESKIICEVHLDFEDLANICIENNCQNYELASGSSTIEIPINLSVGYTTLVVSYNGAEGSFVNFIPVNIIDRPSLSIVLEGFNYVSEYKDQGFNMILIKDSSSNPLNVDVVIRNDLFRKSYYIETLSTKSESNIVIPKEYFKLSNKDMQIIITYQDIHGETYEVSKSLDFSYVNLSLFDRLKLLINSINSSFIKLV
ncbi:MAG: transglutaminase-like domain-containing protein [Candidatus Woesearchaeota archaeon]